MFMAKSLEFGEIQKLIFHLIGPCIRCVQWEWGWGQGSSACLLLGKIICQKAMSFSMIKVLEVNVYLPNKVAGWAACSGFLRALVCNRDILGFMLGNGLLKGNQRKYEVGPFFYSPKWLQSHPSRLLVLFQVV